jgi:hypothetical protein
MRNLTLTTLLTFAGLSLIAGAPARVTVVDPSGRELATFTATAARPAETFHALSEVMQTNWPDARRLAVVCHYGMSSEAVASLADANPDAQILVVDIRHFDNLGRASSLLAQRAPNFLVLLPGDPVVRDGSPGATFLIHAMNNKSIPTFGTTMKAIPQGALACIGAGTDGRLVLNREVDKLQGYIAGIKAEAAPWK